MPGKNYFYLVQFDEILEFQNLILFFQNISAAQGGAGMRHISNESLGQGLSVDVCENGRRLAEFCTEAKNRFCYFANS